MKIVFITEGSKELGLGHIIRCLSLYQSFETEGIKPTIISTPDKIVRELLNKNKFKLIDWLNEEDKIIPYLKNSDIIIVDSLLAPHSFYKKIAKYTRISVFIDDTARMNYPPGIIINRSATDTTFKKDKEHVYLLGLRFLPLTKAFWYVPDKMISPHIKKILITFGGSDPIYVTPKILEFLVKNYPNHEKNVLVGQGFDKINEINILSDKKTKLYFHPTGEELKKLMIESDIAISAAGQTLYELARVGVPTIAIKVVSNQEHNIQHLLSAGFIEYAGQFNEKTTYNKLIKLIKKLDDKNFRERKSLLGRNLVDGYGSVRVANFLIGMASKIA